MYQRKSVFQSSEDDPKKLPMYPIPFHLAILLKHDLKPWPNMPENSELCLKRLKELEKNHDLKVKNLTYCSDFHLLLFVEAFKQKLAMAEFDMYEQKIIRIDNCNKFQIYVEGLEEERPAVAINSFVTAIDTVTKEVYNLKVIRVMKQYLVVESSEKFCLEFLAQRLYDIKFLFNNYPFQCCHYALDQYSSFQLKPYVFPIKLNKHMDNPIANNELIWFNEAIAKNSRQKQAVLSIVDKSNSFPAPYILYGPPGTGKTATLVEAICQASKKSPEDHILVCAPSNTAADVIVRRLINYIPKRDLHRMYSQSKDPYSIDDDIMGCCNCVINIAEDGSEVREIIMCSSVKRIPKIIVTTLCTSTRLLLLQFPTTDFPYIFIDEAGQATEPETLIPFSLLSRSRKERKIVLVGDPQQLGPVIMSKPGKSVLGKSMLERFMTLEPYQRHNDAYNPRYITKLIQNYRSHPALIHISNKLFYNSDLKACNDSSVRKAEDCRILPNKNFPLIFKGELDGQEETSHKSPSSYNKTEVDSVFYYARLLIGLKLGNTIVKQEDIGVITPFTGQKLKIREKLEEDNLTGVEVGTIQLFQGKEKEIIILSTVRSEIYYNDNREHIGFLNDPRRFNVALTRAKSLFIVIGHSATLQVDFNWWYLLNYCCENRAYIGSLSAFRLKLESSFHYNKKKTNSRARKYKKKISKDKAKIEKDFPLVIKNRYSALSNEALRLDNTESRSVLQNEARRLDNVESCCVLQNETRRLKKIETCSITDKKSNVMNNKLTFSSIGDNSNVDQYSISIPLNNFIDANCNIL